LLSPAKKSRGTWERGGGGSREGRSSHQHIFSNTAEFSLIIREIEKADLWGERKGEISEDVIAIKVFSYNIGFAKKKRPRKSLENP